jgi:two-component system sensor histidine kinase/response regulator
MYRKAVERRRILVAEDNPTNQQVAQAILEGAGIAVTIVNNGEAAVEAIRGTPFDAVLMDIQMPRMNGYEATRLIRSMPEGESIPMVAMTAHAMKGDEEKCLEAGMDGYISKPVNQDRLFHTLWRLLRTREPSPEGTALQDPGTSVCPKADAWTSRQTTIVSR